MPRYSRERKRVTLSGTFPQAILHREGCEIVDEANRRAGNLSITLFGSLAVHLDGAPLPPLRARKAAWLLALLTLQQGREVERAWLAGIFWPDAPESQAFFYLRRTLAELRKW